MDILTTPNVINFPDDEEMKKRLDWRQKQQDASPLDNSLDNNYTKDILMQGIPGMGMGQSVTGSDLIPSPLIPSPLAETDFIPQAKPEEMPNDAVKIKQLLNRVSSQQETPGAPPTIKQPETVDELADLKAAQAQRNDTLNNTMILRGLINAGRAIGRQDLDPNIGKGYEQIAENKVKDIGALQDASAKNIDYKKASLQLKNAEAESDPNSEVSKALRESIKMRYASIGHPIKVGDNLSASQLKTMYPSGDLADDFLKMDAMKEARATKAELLKEAKSDKLAKEMSETLDLSKTSSRSPLGVQKMILDDADRALALYNQFKGGNMPAAQSEEFALATARLISGGRSGMSRAQIEALVPHSVRGNIQKTISWLTNDPVGQNQQKFINLMHETALREREIAKGKVDELLSAKLPRFETLKKSDPNAYNRILEGSPLTQHSSTKQAPEQTTNDMVRVLSPEGKPGSIPKSKLKEALAKGFKEI